MSSENDETKLERIKRHLQENKKTYLVGAGCLTVGVSIGSALVFYHLGGVPLEIRQTAKNTALIVWKPEINQIALVKKACREPIPVLDKTTGIPYPSISEAMRATGETMARISKDVHGEALRFEGLPESVFA